jgi:hypothetical protein
MTPYKRLKLWGQANLPKVLSALGLSPKSVPAPSARPFLPLGPRGSCGIYPPLGPGLSARHQDGGCTKPGCRSTTPAAIGCVPSWRSTAKPCTTRPVWRSCQSGSAIPAETPRAATGRPIRNVPRPVGCAGAGRDSSGTLLAFSIAENRRCCARRAASRPKPRRWTSMRCRYRWETGPSLSSTALRQTLLSLRPLPSRYRATLSKGPPTACRGDGWLRRLYPRF